MRRPRHLVPFSFITACICVSIVAGTTIPSSAQDFDLEPNDVPVWEALERYRDSPLCLRSASATSLTVLPGIALRTAHRIVNIVEIHATDLTFEYIANSACLTLEQMIVLASCTTLDCRARPFVHSASARLRERDGRTSVRADVVTDVGRIGGVFDSDEPSTSGADSTSSATFSGWLSASLERTTLHLGAMRVGMGMGLLLGGSGRFGSTVSARSGSMSQAPSVRAHASSYLTGAFNGLAMLHADSSFAALAGYSWHNVERKERAVFAAAQLTNTGVDFGVGGVDVGVGGVDVGVGLLHLNYDATTDSRAASVVNTESLTSVSLFGTRTFATQTFGEVDVRAELVVNSARSSALTIVAHSIARNATRGGDPRWSCGLRNFSADYRAPYAASISDASRIGNEFGGFLAMDVRMQPWALSAALDVHGSLSPRYGSPLPTRGFDIQLSAISRAFDIRARYERDTEGWRPPGDAFTRMRTRSRLSLRGEASLQVMRHVRVRARIDMRLAMYSSEQRDVSSGQRDISSGQRDISSNPSDHGWASFVEAQWQAVSWISARVRYTLFNAPSIDVAPYYVETDAIGAMRTVACSGEGSRMHIALRFNPVAFATLSASVVREERTTALSRPLSGLIQLDVRLPTKP